MNDATTLDAGAKAHAALAITLAKMHEDPGWDDVVALYAESAWARHYLRAGRVAAAIEALRVLDGPRASVNRDRWSAHLAEIAQLVGRDHIHTLNTRRAIAHWQGQAGDHLGAAGDLDLLYQDFARVLGPDTRATLLARLDLVSARAARGNVAQAITDFKQLSVDLESALGSRDTMALLARQKLAELYLTADRPDAAITELKALRVDTDQAVGPDSRQAMVVRMYLASAHGHAGDSKRAAGELEQLLPHAERVLGQNHPDVLSIAGNQIVWAAHSGTITSLTALGKLRKLLASQIHLEGDDSPQALVTRSHICRHLVEIGDKLIAEEELESLLSDQVRILGISSPAVTSTKASLAEIRGEPPPLGFFATDKLTSLVDRRLRSLPPDHPHARVVRRYFNGELNGLPPDHPDARAMYELTVEELGKDPTFLRMTGQLPQTRPSGRISLDWLAYLRSRHASAARHLQELRGRCDSRPSLRQVCRAALLTFQRARRYCHKRCREMFGSGDTYHD